MSEKYTVLIDASDDVFEVAADSPKDAVRRAVGLHLENLGFGFNTLECTVKVGEEQVADYTVDVDCDVSLSLHRNEGSSDE